MTFKQIQDRVLARTNLTTTVARTRVKEFINERLRRVATSVNVGRVRAGSVSVNTVANNNAITTTGLVHIKAITIPAQNMMLDERTVEQLRTYDPDISENGIPRYYAVRKVNATTLELMLYPEPDAIYAVTIDGILTGTDLTADGDIAGLPEDFHDILIYGALADEYPHLKDTDMSVYFETKFDERVKDLRYYMAKSAWLRRTEPGRDPWLYWWLPGLWA